MQISNLETFITLAEIKSFSKAANLLYVSQPALTQRIQKLEIELGFPLIERHSKNDFSLSPSGERFLTFAKDTVQAYQAALKECIALDSAEQRKIVLGLEQFDLGLMNRDYMQAFHLQHPEINLEIEYCMHADLLDHLFKHDMDCVFLAKPEVLPSNYSFTKLTDDAFACIFSPSVHLPETIHIEDLLSYELCFPKDSYYDFKKLEKEIRLRSPETKISYYKTISFLAKADQNKVFISNYGKKDIFRIATCAPLEMEGTISLGLVHLKDLPSHMDEFIKKLQSH